MSKDWLTVQPSLDPLLEPVYDVIERIDSVLAFLIGVLNIVQAILSVVKVFLVGLLNPIRAIVEAIIQAIRNIINDLRQLGVYMASDKNLFVAPFQDLTGGYEAYERRMLARFLDSSDPNRPNFSTSSAVLALFAYVSAEDAVLLVKLIFKIIAFFGDNSPKQTRLYPPPTTPRALFGPQGTFNFTNLSKSLSGDTVPDSMSVSWQMPTDGNLLTPEPKGFLVHISTVPSGFGVLVKRPNSLNSPAVEDLSSDFMVGIDPSSGANLRLYGGISDLGTEARARNFDRFESDDQHSPRLYLMLDQNTPPIRPSSMETDDGKPVGGVTYYVKAGFFQRMGANQSFSAFISKSMLPLGFSVTAGPDGEAVVSTEETSTFYVRVRALSESYTDSIGIGSAPPVRPVMIGENSLHLYTVNYESVVASKSGSVLVPDPPSPTVTFEDFTDPSSPVVVAFPSVSMQEYIRAVQAAVVVAVLCRIDLVEQSELFSIKNTYTRGAQTGLEGSRYIYKSFGVDPDRFYNETDPSSFRRKLRSIISTVANVLLDSTPSNELMELVVENSRELTDFKWSDYDSRLPGYGIIDSVTDDQTSSGIAASPMGAGVPLAGVLTSGITREGIFPSLNPSSTKFVPGGGSADYSPVVYKSVFGTDRFELAVFVRRVLIEHKDGSVLVAAKYVLQVAGARVGRPVGDSPWVTKRFLQDSLAPVDEILTDIERFLIGILEGLQGLIDKIVAYIESIQARIFQLQALIERIRALLNSLRFFDLPSFNALILVENGTSGIVNGLVSSGNKPQDSSLSYGAGAVFVFGGVPTLLLETLELVFSGGE